MVHNTSIYYYFCPNICQCTQLDSNKKNIRCKIDSFCFVVRDLLSRLSFKNIHYSLRIFRLYVADRFSTLCCKFQEHFGRLRGLTVAWVGDGNNVVHSLLMACPKMEINLKIATPSVSELILSIYPEKEESTMIVSSV